MQETKVQLEETAGSNDKRGVPAGVELSNRFQALSMTDDSTNITERYESCETAVREVAETVVGK